MYSMVIMVNNIVFYIWNLLRELVLSVLITHTKETVTMRSNG